MINIEEPIHVAKMLRMGERHRTIAASWRNRQLKQASSDARKANASPKHGLKRMAKQIGGGSAKPLKFVARGAMTNDGE